MRVTKSKIALTSLSMLSTYMYILVLYTCVYVCTCVCACMVVCICECVHLCVCGGGGELC